MPDPILTDFFRVLAIFHHKRGLPEDVFVNSWCFRNDGAIGETAVADNIVPVLDAFYFGAAASGGTLASLMTSGIESAEYRIYDLGTAPPRIPIIRQPDATTTFSGDPELPGEVAVCLSFVAGRNQPRSRGRIFLGPLGKGSVSLQDDEPVPSGLLMATLVDRAENVLNTSENVSWHLVSQADAAAKEVTGGWVDNAFDTMRKRGRRPTSRDSWGTYTS